MAKLAELLTIDLDEAPRRWLTTGFRNLDADLAGFRPGQVWLLTAAPASGRSTLAVQWARECAEASGQVVRLGLGNLPIADVAEMLLSAEAKVTKIKLRTRNLTVDERNRLTAARAHLGALAMEVMDRDDLGSQAIERLAPAAGQRAVIVDDAHLFTDDVPRAMGVWRRAAERHGATVVVTAPEASAVQFGVLRTEWARRIDVHVQISMYPSSVGNCGSAHLDVTALGRGTNHHFAIANQCHYGRFRDLEPTAQP